MLILKKFGELYHVLFEEIVDPRTKPWLLVAKPYQIGTILALYLMFVLKWGPKWMKNRPAFNLDKALIVYNATQILVCTYIFVNAVYYAWGWKYKWICEPVDYSKTPEAINIAWFTYLYYLVKIVDLLDTVFFVLRKKFNQVSFLHIYHHTGMVLLVWAASSYLPGGHGSLVGVINSFVHIIMYSYYLLTVIKPSAKQSFWWKKHITQLQILQFFWCVVHMAVIVFKPDCKYPRWTSAVFLPQNLFMLILFIDFYIKNYIKKPGDKKQKATVPVVSSNCDKDKNCNVVFLNSTDNTVETNEFICLKNCEQNLRNNILNSTTDTGNIRCRQLSCISENKTCKIYDLNNYSRDKINY